MNKKKKVLIIYFLTILIMISFDININNKNFVVLILNKLGINKLFSNGDSGFYYPSIIALTILFINSRIIKKINIDNKLHKDYLIHCFGLIFIIKILQRINELDIYSLLVAIVLISYIAKRIIIAINRSDISI